MSNLLQQLANNEAILLMYLANELPAVDREEVEQMLRQDAQLRAQLDTLRQSYDRFDKAMLLGDGSTGVPSGYMVARSFGETVRSRYEATHSVDEHDEQHRRMHWSIYPAAAAALLAIGMLFWWKSATDAMNAPPQTLEAGLGAAYPEWGGRGGPGGFSGYRRFERWRRPMLDVGSVVSARDALQQPDEVLEAAFDPIILPRYSAVQRSMAALDYLDDTWH